MSAIGRKQASDQAVWLETIKRIKTHGSPSGLDALLYRTIADVQQVTIGKRVAFGWSGGKDSLALEIVCRAAGIKDCVLVICNLEYPAFLKWATDHMPPGLTVWNTEQDLGWLRERPEMLFPQTAAAAGKWFKMVQHTGQERYYAERGLDLLLLGRRREDGNFIGKDGSKGYRNSRGIARYNPLADWSHEDVLGLLIREDVELPPCYGWPRGFQVGTGAWPARQFCADEEQGWREVYQIDPSIVHHAAAAKFEGAARLLDGR